MTVIIVIKGLRLGMFETVVCIGYEGPGFKQSVRDY